MLRSNSTYVITPDSFQISQGIIGLPLARPSRRLTAMLLDLIIVALLVKTAGAMLLGLAAAWFAFRMSAQGDRRRHAPVRAGGTPRASARSGRSSCSWWRPACGAMAPTASAAC